MPRIVFSLCILLLWPQYALPQNTEFIWETNVKQPSRGSCFEVDQETLGKKFKTQVKVEKCKPSETIFLFVSKLSSCFEVDRETQGQKYIQKIKLQKCKPLETVKGFNIINKKSACYEMDRKSMGEYYHKKLNQSECPGQTESLLYWQYEAPGKGKCYEVRKRDDKEVRIKVEDENCRSSDTSFVFIRKNDTSGICVEEDRVNPKSFSLKTKIENCRPKETLYVFYTAPNKKTGNCYEIDLVTKGEQYIQKVENKNCAP